MVNNVEKCIDDELPFEIPDSWEWVRLGNMIQLLSGQDMEPDKYSNRDDGIPYITGASNIKDGEIIINRWTHYPKTIASRGDLLLTCKGTVGAMAFLRVEKAHIARQIMAIKVENILCSNYAKYYIETYVTALKAAAKSMIPGISRDNILLMLFPLPPLAEQNRIAK